MMENSFSNVASEINRWIEKAVKEDFVKAAEADAAKPLIKSQQTLLTLVW